MNHGEPNQVPVSQLGGGEARGNRGCLFYGCLTVLGVFLIATVFTVAGLVIASRQLARFVAENAEDHPSGLPQVEVKSDEVKALKDRLKSFAEALEDEKKTPPEPLELTELEVNQLIQEESELKGVVYVEFEPDRIDGRISLPLEPFSRISSSLKGKYLNGEAEFTAVITDQGLLDVHLVNLKLGNKKDLPVQVKLELQRENLAKEMNADEETRKALKRLDRLEILKDKIRLVPRKPGEGQGGGPEPASEAGQTGSAAESKTD